MLSQNIFLLIYYLVSKSFVAAVVVWLRSKRFPSIIMIEDKNNSITNNFYTVIRYMQIVTKNKIHTPLCTGEYESHLRGVEAKIKL